MARLLVLLAVLFGTPVTAGRKIYDGEEAVALRCANMLALTGMAMKGADLIADEEKDVILGITVLILERHVSGTWAQKKAAMEVMRDRRSIDETIKDYRKNAARCLERFPIN